VSRTADSTRTGGHLACSAVFGQAGASVALRTSSAAVLAEARTSLYCYQQQLGGTAARWQVEVTCDPAVNDLGATGGHGGTGPGDHCLDVGPGITAQARDAGGTGRAFWIPALATLIMADPGRRIIRARCTGQDAARYWACSLTRQAMTSQLLTDGMIYAHAAAFTAGGRGVLAAGHRGSGKTTTLLASLHRLGGDYVTGDRLLLHADGQQVHGYPWPQPLRAGTGTLTALPHLANLVPEPQRGIPAADLWMFPEKVVIEPPGLPRVLADGGKVADRFTFDVMIWPRLDPRCRRVRTERVPPSEVLRTVTRTCMFMTDPDQGTSSHTNHWLAPAPPGHVTKGHLARTATALASAPCYRIHAGADPAALASAVGSVLADLP
jgi:hypothetical protein